MSKELCTCGHRKIDHDELGCKIMIYGIDVRNCQCRYKHTKFREEIEFVNEGKVEE